MEIDKQETNKDNIIRVDAAIHDASLRHRESHFSLPRSHFSLTLLGGEVTSPYSSEVAWALGHVMSVKCEEPIDELTVQVWLLYHHPNFKYCTLFVSGTELRTDRLTDRQTDRQTDDPITRCPRRTFQAGGINIEKLKFHDFNICHNILHVDADADAGGIAIALLY